MAVVENISTKNCQDDQKTIYNFRTTNDIYAYTKYVMFGKARERPIHASSKGFVSSKDNPKEISEEVENVQRLYRKESGLRIRGENVVINKDELSAVNMNENIISTIADRYSDYYLGQGFQNAYGVYDLGDQYVIRYALNPVSFADGSKYRHNNNEIKDNEELCINTIIAEELGIGISKGQSFDFDTLEFSHFIFN